MIERIYVYVVFEGREEHDISQIHTIWRDRESAERVAHEFETSRPGLRAWVQSCTLHDKLKVEP